MLSLGSQKGINTCRHSKLPSVDYKVCVTWPFIQPPFSPFSQPTHSYLAVVVHYRLCTCYFACSAWENSFLSWSNFCPSRKPSSFKKHLRSATYRKLFRLSKLGVNSCLPEARLATALSLSVCLLDFQTRVEVGKK